MFLVSIINSDALLKLIFPIFLISFIFLAIVPIVGVEVKGAKRWLNLYYFNFQPIEVLKPFFILMTVKILTYGKFKYIQIKYFLSFILLCSVIILLIDQPDLGQSILLTGSWVATIFISGVSLTFITIFLLIFLCHSFHCYSSYLKSSDILLID